MGSDRIPVARRLCAKMAEAKINYRDVSRRKMIIIFTVRMSNHKKKNNTDDFVNIYTCLAI